MGVISIVIGTINQLITGGAPPCRDLMELSSNKFQNVRSQVRGSLLLFLGVWSVLFGVFVFLMFWFLGSLCLLYSTFLWGQKKQNCRPHGGLTTSFKTSPWVVQFCFFVFSRFLLLPSKVPKILRKSKTLQTLINLLLIYLSSDSILRHFILSQHTLSCVWDM